MDGQKLLRIMKFYLLLISIAAASDDQYYELMDSDPLSIRSIQHRRSVNPNRLLLGYLAGSIVNTGGVNIVAHRGEVFTVIPPPNSTYDYVGKISGATDYDKDGDGTTARTHVLPLQLQSAQTASISIAQLTDRINPMNLSSKVELAKQLLESNYATLSSQLMGKPKKCYANGLIVFNISFYVSNFNFEL